MCDDTKINISLISCTDVANKTFADNLHDKKYN